ncbi:MAG: hypothetical protein U9O98_05110, partial [Asgard group archaeon]|nr:hypothetical protein [Asgard group archaeon]
TTSLQKKLSERLKKIPYLAYLYSGINDQNKMILYTSSLNCPHIVSEQLRHELQRFRNEENILNFTLQPIRAKAYYGAISTSPITIREKNFQNLVENKNNSIQKNTYYIENTSSLKVFENPLQQIDYNLLYFLSVLKAKYLIKARYGVWVDQCYKLFRLNDISSEDTRAQMDLLNQLDIRARRRNLLDYSLTMRSFSRLNTILITEIFLSNNKKEEDLAELIDRLRIFSWLGLLKFYDRWLFTLPGIGHEHPIAHLIKKEIQKTGFELSQFTINDFFGQFVPYHDLYNFETSKWFHGLEKK